MAFKDKKGEAGGPVSPEMEKAIGEAASDGNLSCAAAHRVAESLGVKPLEVGHAADSLGIRLVRCQLGLFGFYPEKRVVEPMPAVPDELARAVQKVLKKERLACADAWALAKKFSVPKMDVSAACETLGIKIKPCQLGAF